MSLVHLSTQWKGNRRDNNGEISESVSKKKLVPLSRPFEMPHACQDQQKDGLGADSSFDTQAQVSLKIKV